MSVSIPYRKGLHEVGPGAFAYLQPDGGYGYSNAGLVVGGGSALLIDTLFDLPLAGEMLDTIGRAVPAARIEAVVNTHAHPDHTAGNELLPDAEIVASTATLAEMTQAASGANPIREILENWTEHGEAGEYLHEVMGRRFAAHRGREVLPGRGFDDELDLHIGATQVRLVRVGPAHTRGDVVAYLPAERVLFAGDIVFNRVHPIVIGAMVPGWLAACDRLLAWDIDVVVPGHGPVTDVGGLRAMAGYLRYFRDEARRRFDDGMDYATAAAGISLGEFDGWADQERIFMTVAAFYESLGARRQPMADVMTAAWRYRRARA